MRVQNDADVETLQNELDKVDKWCNDNKMVLNINKCYHVKFTKKKNPLPSNYRLRTIELQETNSIKDLGIVVDGSLIFRDHIDKIINKASQLSGFLSRQIKSFKDPKVVIPVYNCLVRSKHFGV